MVKTDVIILAGGISNRFGMPKPFLSFDSNSSFLEKIVSVYQEFGCCDVVLVMNQKHSPLFCSTIPELFRSKIKIIYNSRTELGRFYSIKLGVDSLTDSDYCFIQNIDNPFTDTNILKLLFESREENSYVSPAHLNKGGHPILLPRMIISKIREEKNIERNTKEFLNQFNKINVGVKNDKVLANINTPEDYEIYFKKPVSINKVL